MVEYSGYVPVKPIDWTAKTSEITGKFLDTYYDREKKRADQQAEVDNFISEVGKLETTNSQTFNNFVLNGAQSATSFIQSQNDLFKKGLLDQNTLKRNIQNSREGFSNLKILTDGINERIRIGTERMNNGQAAPMEEYIQDHIYDIIDVSNKQYIQDENGNGYVVSLDGKTKISTKSLNNMLNQFIDRPDIISDVDKAVKGLGVSSLNKDGKYVISARLTGDWEGTKNRIANDILASPQKAANVLAMQFGYSFTMDPEEAKGDSNKILLTLDPNGAYVPSLTKEQKSQAVDVVKKEIQARVGYEEKERDPNERAKIALENRKIDAEIIKLQSSDRKEQMPYLYRLKAINDVLSGTSEGMAAIIGKPLAYAASRGLEEEGGKDPKKLYAGYVVEDIIPQKNGTYKVVMKIDSKSKDGKTVKKTKEFSYTRRNLVSDINQTLNGIGGNANLSNDRILAEFDMFSGTTAAPTTTASSTQAP
jgi:hypothetical protein